MKYLFKYVCNAHDSATIELIGEPDNPWYHEIKNFQNAQYVSTHEVLWRLYGFNSVDRSPPVVHADVRLENHYAQYSGKEQAGQAPAQIMAFTKITEWFQANKKY